MEMHLPGYRYCGAGTNLERRLERGDAPINKLDEACRDHDVAYSLHTSENDLSIADRELACKAWDLLNSEDAGRMEKAAAFVVASAMCMNVKAATLGSIMVDWII